MKTLIDECARELMEAVPQLMQFFREEMRAGRAGDLSVPQFRTLVWLRRHPKCGLGDLAEGMGLSAPSMSKLVDALVRRGMVSRISSREDRRRVILSLTPGGEGLLRIARASAAQAYSQRLAGLSGAELEQVTASLRTLRALFLPRDAGYAPQPPAGPTSE